MTETTTYVLDRVYEFYDSRQPETTPTSLFGAWAQRVHKLPKNFDKLAKELNGQSLTLSEALGRIRNTVSNGTVSVSGNSIVYTISFDKGAWGCRIIQFREKK